MLASLACRLWRFNEISNEPRALRLIQDIRQIGQARDLSSITMVFRPARIARTAPSPGSDFELIIGEVVCNCITSDTVKLRVHYVFITFLQCLLNRKDIPLTARDHAIAHRDILLEGMIIP